MKNILLMTFICLIYNILDAQRINFQPSLSIAFEKAKLENKLVFVEYYSSTCSHCTQLEPFLKDSTVVAFYNANFINYKLNIENIKTEDKNFLEKSTIQPDATPFFLFFDKNEQFCHYANTKREVAYLIEVGETALDENERSSNLPNKYRAGDRSIKTLYAYTNMARLLKKDSLADALADDLYNVFPTQNLGSKKSYLILKNSVRSIENGFFQYWINHIEDIKAFNTEGAEKKAGSEKVDLTDIIHHSIFNPKSKEWDLKKIQEVKNMVIKLGMSENPDTYFWQQEIPLLLKENRHAEALQIAERILNRDKTGIQTAEYFLNQYLTLFNDKKDFEMIQHWIDEKAIKADANADKLEFMYLKTLCFQKSNEKQKAFDACKMAIEFAQKNSLDTARLDKILEELK